MATDHVASQSPLIFIATSAYDRPCIEQTISLLRQRDCNVLVFNSDEVANGKKQFSIHIDTSGEPIIRYEERRIDPRTIKAAWYRRPNIFGLEETPLRAYSLTQEYRALQRFFWDSIPPDAWLNDPRNMRAVNNKLFQLTLAKKVGFDIPETLVSNRWEEITALKSPHLTFKMPDGYAVHTPDGTSKVMGSKKLPNDPAELPLSTLPYPGIWQQYIPKKREWRVTVVGDQYFSTAIYTHSSAKDDWRRHQENEELVHFAIEPFPKKLGLKCCEYVKRCNLTYGAFDFIEQPDGKIIFLEMNTNGQFVYLEGPEIPVSRAIADKLIAISQRTKAT